MVFAGLLLVLHLVSPAGLGFGDVKLGLLLGLYLGAVRLSLVLWGLLLARWSASSSPCPVAVRARNRHASIPFGPALAAGTVLALLLGRGGAARRGKRQRRAREGSASDEAQRGSA